MFTLLFFIMATNVLIVRALNTLTYGFSYIMRYIVLVIFSINSTQLRLVLLIEKMTRTIYLIMYSKPYVNAYIPYYSVCIPVAERSTRGPLGNFWMWGPIYIAENFPWRKFSTREIVEIDPLSLSSEFFHHGCEGKFWDWFSENSVMVQFLLFRDHFPPWLQILLNSTLKTLQKGV